MNNYDFFSVYMTTIRQDTDELVVAYCVHHRAQHTYSCRSYVCKFKVILLIVIIIFNWSYMEFYSLTLGTNQQIP